MVWRCSGCCNCPEMAAAVSFSKAEGGVVPGFWLPLSGGVGEAVAHVSSYGGGGGGLAAGRRRWKNGGWCN